MPTYEIQGPDGRTLSIDGPAPPSEAELDAIFAAVAQRHRQALRTHLASVVSKGRPVAKVEGTWVTDCAELQQCILLCSFCDHKFKPSHSKYGYWRDRNSVLGVGGTCDGCRVFQDSGIQLYIHESNVGRSYTPR